jgi:SMC interacting uncharacterized protein involved in chromosome segregation
MTIRANLKSQIDSLASRVTQAEKTAAKQVRNVLKSTEKFRGQQLKRVQLLLKKAEKLKATPLAKRAEEVRSQIESGASAGLQFLIAKLNVPSRAEVERLNKKISGLQKRIDELEKASRKSS